MRKSKVAVVLGAVLLVLGFCLGVETPGSATVDGERFSCDDAISPGMLVAGAGGGTSGPVTASQQRVDAACAPVETAGRWLTWGVLGLGGLVLLVGWTALREDVAVGSGPPRFTAVPR